MGYLSDSLMMGISYGHLVLFLCIFKLSDAYFFRGLCYADSRNRVLPYALKKDYSMTIEKCIAHCRSCDYDYAGVEYGHECWCGNKEPAYNLRRHYSECSTKCPGNHYQRCGASLRINVYTTGLCYKDSATRVLPHAKINDHSLTIERCIAHCHRINFDYAGVEFAHQCFCGNLNPSSSLKRPQSECNVKCKGNHHQKCGGGWRINVYKVGSSIRGNRNLQSGYENKQIQSFEKEEIEENFEKEEVEEMNQNFEEEFGQSVDQMEKSFDEEKEGALKDEQNFEE